MTDTATRFRVYDQQQDRCQIGEFRYLIQRRVGTHSIDVWTTVAAAHDFGTAQMFCDVARVGGTAA